jgi:hypothetical protein
MSYTNTNITSEKSDRSNENFPGSFVFICFGNEMKGDISGCNENE